jgi:hypothetical protein
MVPRAQQGWHGLGNFNLTTNKTNKQPSFIDEIWDLVQGNFHMKIFQ